MKRILLFALLLLMQMPLFGQITVKEANSIKMEKISDFDQNFPPFEFRLNGGRIVINRLDIPDGNTVYMLVVWSTNRYDEAHLVSLGKTPESALETLQDLSNLCDQAIGSKYEICTYDEPSLSGSFNCSEHIIYVTDRSFNPSGGKDERGSSITFVDDEAVGKLGIHKKSFDILIRRFKKDMNL